MNTSTQQLLLSSTPTQEASLEISLEETPSETAFQKLFDAAPEESDPSPSLFDLIEEEELPEEEEEKNLLTSCGFSPQPLCIQEISTSSTPQGVSLSSPLIDALFEKMASSMVIMTSSHEQQTSLVLDAPRFSSSCLFGTRITITEFSTAPKAFNVEILSNPGAISLIQQSTPHLLATFDRGDFPFTINRFDTHLEPTRNRFVLQRKENEDHGEQDQQEERNP